MKQDIYQRVTDRILEKLDEGTVPWRKTWDATQMMPMNLVSKKAYRGVNVWLLLMGGYDSPYWLTFNQAKQFGGNIKKGEKSSMVVFWNWFEKKDPVTGEVDKIPFLRYYNVFNVNQCEGLDEKIPEQAEVKAFDPIEACVAIESPVEVRHGMVKAYYSPGADYIGMPNGCKFENEEAYYATLFHEMVHSTGHKSRLSRKHNESAPSNYCQEELVAEFGASFLCAQTGIENQMIDNSASYIAGWRKILFKEKKMVIMAAAQAQKAVDCIMKKETAVVAA